MNRFKKFELQKYNEKRVGLTVSEIEQLDISEKKEREFLALVREIHLSLFPEEYTFTLDSHADARDRRLGINPMHEDYTKRVQKRRTDLGINPLDANGMPPISNDSWKYARERALEAG